MFYKKKQLFRLLLLFDPKMLQKLAQVVRGKIAEHCACDGRVAFGAWAKRVRKAYIHDESVPALNITTGAVNVTQLRVLALGLFNNSFAAARSAVDSHRSPHQFFSILLNAATY